MQLDVEREVAALERMTVGQLRERFGEVFGEQTNARHKQWLINELRGRCRQTSKATIPSGLGDEQPSFPRTSTCERRLLKNASRWRLLQTRRQQQRSKWTPTNACHLRDHAGQAHTKGNRFKSCLVQRISSSRARSTKSLSAVAKKATGQHCNGFQFFKLNKPEGTNDSPIHEQAIELRDLHWKSTEDGLEKEFNSLDAQRESGEAYIKSQSHEGWHCLLIVRRRWLHGRKHGRGQLYEG